MIFDKMIADLLSALGSAANADPLMVLLPLVVVALRQGLSASGLSKVPGATTSGMALLGGVMFVWNGILGVINGTFSAGGYMTKNWNQLMGLSIKEMMGFWILLAVGIFVVVLVRGFAKR
ncbi:MAG: hypothetical protein AAFX52_12325 [Pseudomonadota bacterium]